MAVAVVLTTFTLCAQEEQRPRRTPEQEAAKQTVMLAQYLSLTQNQIDSIYNVHYRYAVLRRQPQQEGNRRLLFEQMLFEVRRFLTDEQKVKFEEMQKENKRIMENRRVMFRDSLATAPATTPVMSHSNADD